MEVGEKIDNNKPLSKKSPVDKTNKYLMKMNDRNRNKTKLKDANSTNKSRLLYEKIKKRIFRNNNNIHNNHYTMKYSKNNNDKSYLNLNKTFNENLTNNLQKNNLNITSNSVVNLNKTEKKLTKYAAKINNYYNNFNNYTLINSDIKNLASKYSKNMEISKKKRGSIPDNNNKNFYFNLGKYLNSSKKIHSSYSSKKNIEKGRSLFHKLNNSTSNNRYNSVAERTRTFTLNNNKTKGDTIAIDNIMNSLSEIKEKKTHVINIFKKNKNISSKEEAFYILSTSPVLRLCEQLIFSRATKNIKSVITSKSILENHKVFLNAKVNELKKEIDLCEKKIKTPFVASKIADINLNFITSLDEQEFKNYDIFEVENQDLNIYYNYIKLLYLLFGMDYDNNLDGKNLKKNLFEKVKEKGFRYIRDYLYYIYIDRREENLAVTKIEIINDEIIKNASNVLNFNEALKICRFMAFSNFLIKEIINYANNLKDMLELKIKAQNLMDIILIKIDKIKNKNKKKKLKRK